MSEAILRDALWCIAHWGYGYEEEAIGDMQEFAQKVYDGDLGAVAEAKAYILEEERRHKRRQRRYEIAQRLRVDDLGYEIMDSPDGDTFSILWDCGGGRYVSCANVPMDVLDRPPEEACRLVRQRIREARVVEPPPPEPSDTVEIMGTCGAWPRPRFTLEMAGGVPTYVRTPPW